MWAWPATLAFLIAMSTACDDPSGSRDFDHKTVAIQDVIPAPSPTPGQVLLECARVRPRDGVLRWVRYEYGPEQATMRFGLRGVDATAPVRGTVDVLLNGEQEIKVAVAQSAKAGSQASVDAGRDPVALPSTAVEHTGEELSVTLDPCDHCHSARPAPHADVGRHRNSGQVCLLRESSDREARHARAIVGSNNRLIVARFGRPIIGMTGRAQPEAWGPTCRRPCRRPRRSWGVGRGRLLTNFVRLVDKSLREYDAARAELLLVRSAQRRLPCQPLSARGRPHGELHRRHPRSVLNAKALLTLGIGRGAATLTTRQESLLSRMPHAIEHSDEKVVGKQFRNSPPFAPGEPYLLRLATTSMILGSNMLPYRDLVSSMSKMHRAVEKIRRTPTGTPGPSFPNAILRTEVPGRPAVSSARPTE
jgi:hypothetical protein